MSDRPTVALSFSSIPAEPQSYPRRSIRSRRRPARRSTRREPIEDGERDALLGPGEVKVLVVAGTAPVADRARRNNRTLAEALKAPRIAIERIAPSVDDGAFPIKRVVGRPSQPKPTS